MKMFKGLNKRTQSQAQQWDGMWGKEKALSLVFPHICVVGIFKKLNIFIQ